MRQNVMLQLASDKYAARPEVTDLTRLVKRPLRQASEERVVFGEWSGTGDVALARSLMLDPMLVNIILDNLFSNAEKYKSTTSPLVVVTQRIDLLLCNGKQAAAVIIRVRNVCDKASIFEKGETALNAAAAQEGGRLHGEQHNK
jgi:hypothetical protein